MSSLRERQRQHRTRAILDAAWTLFSERGFDETSIEEIAERAEVGPATVYTYFGSKNKLLAALFVRYIEQEAAEAETVLQQPPGNMLDGMMALFDKYLEGVANRCSPLLLREFYALGISRQFDYGRHTFELKQRFLDQGLRLATHYKASGQVREDVSAEEAAALCHSAAVFPLTLFSLGLGIDLDTARQMLRRYLTLTLTGIGSAAKRA